MARKTHQADGGAPVDRNDEKLPETKAQKFRRLAQRRVTKALKAIAALKALSNRRQYERTDTQTEALMNVMYDAWISLKSSYDGEASKPDGFTLPD